MSNFFIYSHIKFTYKKNPFLNKRKRIILVCSFFAEYDYNLKLLHHVTVLRNLLLK